MNLNSLGNKTNQFCNWKARRVRNFTKGVKSPSTTQCNGTLYVEMELIG